MALQNPTTCRDLCSCLSGRIPVDVDWQAVLAAANESFLTTELAVSLKGDSAPGVPDQVRDYVSYIYAQNEERNRRLLAQLRELIAGLNSVGLTPTLTKGAAFLAQAPPADLGRRMMFDLDLVVETDEIERANGALAQLGYREIPWVGWWRPQDAGSVDLHFPPGRYPAFWPDRAMIASHMSVLDIGGATALVPSPFLRARHVFVHDMIKNGAWWLCTINLRDVHEMHRLVSEHHIAWAELDAGMPDDLSRLALGSQYLVIQSLFPETRPGDALPVRPLSKRHASLRLAKASSLLGLATRTLGPPAWFVRCAQIKWRSRLSTRHVLERVALKAMKAAGFKKHVR